MDKRLRELQSRLDEYWKTTYADKLRQYYLDQEREEVERVADEQHKKKLQDLSLQIETYQETMMKPKEKSKRDKMYEHERKCGAFLLNIRQTVRLMNDIGDKKELGRKERLEYDELKERLKELLEKLHLIDEETWKVANKYVEENLNVISIW